MELFYQIYPKLSIFTRIFFAAARRFVLNGGCLFLILPSAAAYNLFVPGLFCPKRKGLT
jgi:hypothetical protein